METISDEHIDFELVPKNSSDAVNMKLVSFSDKFTKGRVLIKEQLSFLGRTGAEATLKFKSNSQTSSILKDFNKMVDFNFPLEFRKCDLGDVYDTRTTACTTCTKGTFSLQDPYSEGAACQSCPNEAQCLGGSMIPPKLGYYRLIDTSSRYKKCEIEDSCEGGFVDEFYYPSGKCKAPYYGKVCSQCDYQSAKFGGAGKCHSCQNEISYYIRFIVLFGIQIIALIFTIYLNLRRAVLMKQALDENDDDKKQRVVDSAFNAVLIKIGINFFLAKGIINSYGFKWPGFLNQSIAFIVNMLPTTEQGFSVDCFIVLITDDYSKVFYTRLVLIILKPICIWVFFLGVYFLLRKCFFKNSKLSSTDIKDRVMLTILAISYMMQTEIIISCLKLFKCSNYSTDSNPVYFLDSNPQIQCFTGSHTYWSWFFAIPLFLIWGIILPYILFRKARSVVNDPYRRLRYMFIFAGMKDSHYYWEFVILIRKELMVLILVFLPSIQTGGQTLFSFLVLVTFTYIHITRQPYNDPRLNKVETWSLVSSQLMLITGIYFLFKDVDDQGIIAYTLTMISFLSNVIFFFLLGYYGVQAFKRNVRRVIKSVRDKSKTSKIGSRQSSLQISECGSQVEIIPQRSTNQKLSTFAATLQERIAVKRQESADDKNFNICSLNNSQADLISRNNSRDVSLVGDSLNAQSLLKLKQKSSLFNLDLDQRVSSANDGSTTQQVGGREGSQSLGDDSKVMNEQINTINRSNKHKKSLIGQQHEQKQRQLSSIFDAEKKLEILAQQQQQQQEGLDFSVSDYQVGEELSDDSGLENEQKKVVQFQNTEVLNIVGKQLKIQMKVSPTEEKLLTKTESRQLSVTKFDGDTQYADSVIEDDYSVLDFGKCDLNHNTSSGDGDEGKRSSVGSDGYNNERENNESHIDNNNNNNDQNSNTKVQKQDQ